MEAEKVEAWIQSLPADDQKRLRAWLEGCQRRAEKRNGGRAPPTPPRRCSHGRPTTAYCSMCHDEAYESPTGQPLGYLPDEPGEGFNR